VYSVFDELILQAARGVNLLVKFVVIAVILLMILRWFFLRISPFGWVSYQIRRLTDPMIWPLSQSLPMPNAMSIAPLIVVLITLLGAYFLQAMVEELLSSLRILLSGVVAGEPLRIFGGLLYGAVSILMLLIIVRIVSSWVPFIKESRFMWTVFSLTEPIMAPFREIIPPIGMFDLSPIILIFLMNIVKAAIGSLLLQ
jgi:YggT family protein